MSGGGKGGDDGAADQARADETKREADIKGGTAKINQIFDGYDTGADQIAAGTTYNPTSLYYNADGSLWQPATSAGDGTTNAPGGLKLHAGQQLSDAGIPFTPGGNALSDNKMRFEDRTGMHQVQTGWGVTGGATGGGSGGSARVTPTYDYEPNSSGGQPVTAADAFAAAAAGGKLYGAKKHNGGFDDDFWNQRRQAYEDYALPQITDQRDDATKQLTFALDRAGTLDSSIRSSKTADLQKLYDKNILTMNDQAQDYVNQGKTSVEDARANLIATLNATGDAQGAANSAMARASTLAAAPNYSPLTNLFQDFTSTLGNANASNLSFQTAYGGNGGGAQYGPSSLTGNSKSVKVT